jgi:glucose/arabinose dehydrogenase
MLLTALVAPAPTAWAQMAKYPPGFSHTVVAGSLDNPTAFAFFPDGRIAIAEKVGIVRLVKDGQLQPTPLIDIRDRVNDYWDRGLIGIAVDPDFANRPYVYLFYSYEHRLTDYFGTKVGRVSRITVSGDTADPGTEKVLVGTEVAASCNDLESGADCLPGDAPAHMGGGIKFSGDTIFITAGDAADFNGATPNSLRAQNIDSLGGKVLRVGRDGGGLPSNPFWNGDPKAARSKVWAYGLRNPFRISLRPGQGGSVVYVGEVGWYRREEIDVVVAGGNYGWPCYEGSERQPDFAGYSECQALYAQGAGKVRPPLHEYEPGAAGVSVVGGAFPTNGLYPESYRGAYIFGDYVQGWLRVLRLDGNNSVVPQSLADFAQDLDGPVAVEIGRDGLLYYLAIGAGELRRLDFSAANTPPSVVLKANRTAGLKPFRVQFNASGTRDPDRDKLTYQWDFGDGTQGKGARPAHTYRPPDSAIYEYVATVTVTDSKGAAVQENITITVGNRQPIPRIGTPAATRRFAVGEVVEFSGSATDQDEGPLADSALSWRILLHHCPAGQCHIHPFLDVPGATGSFTVPEHGGPGENIRFELLLTATDSNGLTRTVSRIVRLRR